MPSEHSQRKWIKLAEVHTPRRVANHPTGLAPLSLSLFSLTPLPFPFSLHKEAESHVNNHLHLSETDSRPISAHSSMEDSIPYASSYPFNYCCLAGPLLSACNNPSPPLPWTNPLMPPGPTISTSYPPHFTLIPSSSFRSAATCSSVMRFTSGVSM